MNFILFGNLSYGEAAIKKFVQLSRAYFDHNFRIVLSGKEIRQTDKDQLLYVSDLNKTQDFVNPGSELSNRLSFPLETEVDVNSDRFINTLPEDTIGFCVGFNQMFSAQFLDRILMVINFHPSLLPFYRGPTPAYWCLKRGETRTGYTAHVMTKKVERVNIIFQDVVEIKPLMTTSELETRIGQKASEYVEDMVLRFLTGKDMRYQILDAESIYKYPGFYFSFPEIDKIGNGKIKNRDNNGIVK